MKCKSVEKTTAIPLRESSLMKKSKNILRPTVQKSQVKNSSGGLRSKEFTNLKLKAKTSSPKKHVAKLSTPKKTSVTTGSKVVKQSGQGNVQKIERKKKKAAKTVVSKDRKPKALQKSSVNKSKGKSKGKGSNQGSINQFIDIMSLSSMGKREASLNASMKVNIMYERQISPKKSSSTESSPVKTTTPKSPAVDGKKANAGTANSESPKGSPRKKLALSPKTNKKESPPKSKSVSNSKCQDKNPKPANKKSNEDRKRKSNYTIYEDGQVKKARKKENEKNQTNKKKSPKKTTKSSVLGHHLGNIIEKSPRQASLNAKAMIAMEQEDDAPIESAARTLIYDWTEVRSCGVSDTRKMVWVTGSGDQSSIAKLKKSRRNSLKNALASMGSLVNEGSFSQESESSSLHTALLKEIHATGDARLLKEFFRSQKEDFQGEVDIEEWHIPEPAPVPEKSPATTPSPKKKSTPHSTPTKKTDGKKIKPVVSSPSKATPSRVATPIPQFPSAQRPSHMTSFIPHLPSQSLYPPVGQQKQSQQQQPPQPIKVTPYAPSSYVYQYSPERQQNIFVPNAPSPMSYSADANDLVQRNFPATLTFNHIGGLSFQRRGMNPYQTQNNAYNTSAMHLPIPPVGFNFSQFYNPSLHLHNQQQNLPPMPGMPLAHHQYPLVNPSGVMQQPHTMGTNLSSIRPYPSSFTQFSAASQDMNQDKPCMPAPPVSQSLAPASPVTSIVQPLPSYRRAVPPSPHVQCHTSNLIKPSPERLCAVTTVSSSATKSSFVSPNESPTKTYRRDTGNVRVLNPSPIKLPTGAHVAFRPIICKKESKLFKPPSDSGDAPLNLESPKRTAGNLKPVEESSMAEILHSAHSTMFTAEEKCAVDQMHSPLKHCKATMANTSSPTKVPQVPTTVLTNSNSGLFSVSSILEMPNYKVKKETKTKTCAVNTDESCSVDKSDKGVGKETYYLCVPAPPKQTGKPGTSLLTTTAIPLKEIVPLKVPEKQHSSDSRRDHIADDKVIVIDDSSASSDDEPLSKLLPSKPSDDMTQKLCDNEQEVPKNLCTKTTVKPLKIKLFEKKSKEKPPKVKQVKMKLNTKDSKDVKKQSKAQNSKPKKVVDLDVAKASACLKQPTKKDADVPQMEKISSADTTSQNCASIAVKKAAAKVVKKAPVRRKSKAKQSIPPMLPKVKATHGWSWIGEGEWKMIPKLTQQEPVRIQKSYKTMKHQYGEVISVRDCVILQSDGDGAVPYVGKVSALWENAHGDMMFSMLWFYQPEHTAVGREPEDGEQELFASKHREENSVACIDDKCYVLMYNEYCRMEANAVRNELGLSKPKSHQMIPQLCEEDRKFLRPLPPPDMCCENLFFCRYDYDIRKKIVKKPKHKKTDLRYRGPCKLQVQQ